MSEKNTRPRVQFIHGNDGQPAFAVMPLIEYVRLLERANEAFEEQGRPAQSKCRLFNVHPVEVLENEFMRPNGLSWNDLAEKTGLSCQAINGLRNREERITVFIAEPLSSYFGTAETFWLGLQANYDVMRERELRAQGE